MLHLLIYFLIDLFNKDSSAYFVQNTVLGALQILWSQQGDEAMIYYSLLQISTHQNLVTSNNQHHLFAHSSAVWQSLMGTA